MSSVVLISALYAGLSVDYEPGLWINALIELTILSDHYNLSTPVGNIHISRKKIFIVVHHSLYYNIGIIVPP